jgi:hypothetical protein
MSLPGPFAKSLLALALLAVSTPTWAEDEPKTAPSAAQLPADLQGAKVYRLPEEGKSREALEDPIVYKGFAFEDINLERLVLNLSLGIKPVDRAATIQKIYFQDIRVNGIPLQVEPFDQEFKLSKTETVDLPAPLKCTILFASLDSLAPLKQVVTQDKVTVTGQSFLEFKLNTLQKMAVRAKRLVLPVAVKEEVPLQMFGDNSFIKMAATSVLDTLSDPSSGAAMALAKTHLAKITGERALEQKSRSALCFLYSEYVLKDPKSGAGEKFSQSGTGFVIAAEGVLLTAKRVVEPWKFDPQTALLISRDHLEVDPQSIRLAAWPAGASVLGSDGAPDLQSALTTVKQTLRVVRLAPDKFETQDFRDPDSGEQAAVSVHSGGMNDVAVLQLTGGSSQPLDLAGPDEKIESASGLTLLGFPFGLSQAQVVPKPMAAKASTQNGLIHLDHGLNPGQAGAPLLSEQGKVLGLCTEPDQCIPVESLRKLIP